MVMIDAEDAFAERFDATGAGEHITDEGEAGLALTGASGHA